MGIFDVAQDLDLKSQPQDFGNTFHYWGLKESPYIVLPLIGPSTFANATGTALSMSFINPINHISLNKNGIKFSGSVRNSIERTSLKTIDKINTRAMYLSTDKIVKGAIDPYVAIRDGYLNSINKPTDNQSDDYFDSIE